MKWNSTLKEKILYAISISALLVGFGITIAGFCVPPVGEIHSTVLIVLGQCFVYSGALLGYKLSVKNGVSLVNEEISKCINERFSELDAKTRGAPVPEEGVGR